MSRRKPLSRTTTLFSSGDARASPDCLGIYLRFHKGRRDGWPLWVTYPALATGRASGVRRKRSRRDHRGKVVPQASRFRRLALIVLLGFLFGPIVLLFRRTSPKKDRQQVIGDMQRIGANQTLQRTRHAIDGPCVSALLPREPAAEFSFTGEVRRPEAGRVQRNGSTAVACVTHRQD